MSYLDFERGISAESLRRQRESDAAERLRAEMTQRWRESERILGILRTIGSIPEEIAGMEQWFSRVRMLGGSEMEHAPRTPNDWFQVRFPEAVRQFGRAFFEETKVSLHGAQVEIPAILNEDFFAALLAGEKRLGHRIIHRPGDGFWFYDPRVDAFCQTTESKIELLLSNYLVKCAEALGCSVDTRVLIAEHRRPALLNRVVNKAKTVLETDDRFFEGIKGHRKFLAGKLVVVEEKPSPVVFIASTVTRHDGGMMVVGDAFQEYVRYCTENGLQKVGFAEFKRIARDAIYERFQLGLRHDLKTPEGRQTHGWKHLRLLPEPGMETVCVA